MRRLPQFGNTLGKGGKTADRLVRLRPLLGRGVLAPSDPQDGGVLSLNDGHGYTKIEPSIDGYNVETS